MQLLVPPYLYELASTGALLPNSEHRRVHCRSPSLTARRSCHCIGSRSCNIQVRYRSICIVPTVRGASQAEGLRYMRTLAACFHASVKRLGFDLPPYDPRQFQMSGGTVLTAERKRSSTQALAEEVWIRWSNNSRRVNASWRSSS